MQKTIKLYLHHTGHEVYFYRRGKIRRYDLAKNSKRWDMFRTVFSHYRFNAAKYGYTVNYVGLSVQTLSNEQY